jgi:hypothetical protein
MIQVNVMSSFQNRLLDRGWKSVNVRGYSSLDTQVLVKGKQHIVVVQNCTVDASVKILPQMEAFFHHLQHLLGLTLAKEVFLTGGGTFPIPHFFTDFCTANGIKLHLLSVDNFEEYAGFQ